jgi:hypothetical protein
MCAIGIITLVVGAFFFRLFWPTQQLIITPDFGQSDAVLVFSTKIFYSTQISHYRIPLWTSLFGGGYPILAFGSMGAFFLPNLIFFSILTPVTAYNVALVLSLCFMGWGIYVWLRLMKYGSLACMFGAITTVLSGYCVTQLTHIMIVQSYCLFPWLAALTLSLANKKSWFTVGWFIILLSQQIFIGFPQSVFITLLFLIAYWVWLMRGNREWRQKTFRFMIALTFGCIASAAQLLPSWEYSKTLVTANGYSPDQATTFSYPFKHLLTLINPFALGNPATGTYPHFSQFGGSIFWENTAYIGVVPLIILAFYFCIAVWKKMYPRTMVFFIIILAASLLLMTGRNSPLYLIYSLWPFNIFRVPSRFIWLFEIALIVLSVHAFDRLIGFVKKMRIILPLALLVICAHTLSLFIIWSPYHKLTNASGWLRSPPITQYIDRNFYTISIGAEGLYNSLYAPHGWLSLEGKNDPAYFLRNTLTPDKNMVWNVPQIGEDTARTIRRSGVLTDVLNQSITMDTSNATISAEGRKLLTLLSVKNVISALPLTQEGLSHTATVSYENHSIDLYENPDALPPVYFAKDAIPVHTVEEAAAAFASNAFIPGDSVLVEFDATPAATLARAAAEIKTSGQGMYLINATNPDGDAILVLTQTYYPGWHATIDTKEVSVFPVNVKHIGVLVPAGTHTVEFQYRPDSFVYGVWISGISLGVTIFLMVFGFFRSLLNTHQTAAVRAPYPRRNRGRYLPHNR